MKNWQSILLGTLLGLIASAIILLIASPPRGEAVILPPIPTVSSIMVYVSGAVQKPGVISLPRQSRVFTAIEEAGGFTSDADQNSINLAARINDGDRINIPSKSDQATQAAYTPTPFPTGSRANVNTPTPTPNFPIDINTATALDLENLPTIGPTKAVQIVEYRQQHGLFKKIEDIQNVPGIGPATFEKIKKNMISVNN